MMKNGSFSEFIRRSHSDLGVSRLDLATLILPSEISRLYRNNSQTFLQDINHSFRGQVRVTSAPPFDPNDDN